MLTSALVAYGFLHYDQPLIYPRHLAAQNQVVQAPGSLTIEPLEPVAVTTVPPGSQRVPLLTLAFRADCWQDVPVHTVSLRRVGLGASGDIASVYAISDGIRYSRPRALSARDGRVTLSLRRFIVPACQTRYLQIMVDFAADAAVSGQHRFILEKEPVAASAGSVRAQLPWPAPIRQLTPAYNRGSLSVQVQNQSGRVAVGDRAVLASFILGGT